MKQKSALSAALSGQLDAPKAAPKASRAAADGDTFPCLAEEQPQITSDPPQTGPAVFGSVPTASALPNGSVPVRHSLLHCRAHSSSKEFPSEQHPQVKACTCRQTTSSTLTGGEAARSACLAPLRCASALSARRMPVSRRE